MAIDLSLINLQLFQEGDKDEFKKVVEALGAPLFVYIEKKVKDLHDTEDLHAETITEIWKSHRRRFKSTKHLMNFAFRAAKLNIKDYFRSQRRRLPQIPLDEEHYIDELPDTDPSSTSEILDVAVAEEAYRRITKAVKDLGIEDLECTKVLMLYLDGKKTPEIADQMGISPRTVVNQKNIAIKKVGEYIKQHGFRLWLQLVILFFSIF